MVDIVWCLMARRQKRLWTDEEKRSICFQTTTPDVSVAQVARRYAMNSNLIFKWLRDPRFAPGPTAEPEAPEPSYFLPVEIVGQVEDESAPTADGTDVADGRIDIDIAGGHRLRVTGSYDPEALARLIRGLST